MTEPEQVRLEVKEEPWHAGGRKICPFMTRRIVWRDYGKRHTELVRQECVQYCALHDGEGCGLARTWQPRLEDVMP